MQLVSPHTVQRVVTCYSVFDKYFPTTGLLDYTEGIYNGDPSTPYEQAKRQQFDYLLDQIACGPGVRVLEVGCGNGTLLERIRERGGEGVGITITPDQVRVCRERGLEVQLMDIFDVDPTLHGRFDAIVANGPIEHFVQPEQAAAGQQDDIYRRMFDVFHRLLDPASSIRRVVNTTVHFAERPEPEHLTRSPWSWRPWSDNFHYCMLVRSFGGYYPEDGQLERCADGRFELLREVDGTLDYYYTSEEWLRRIRRALVSPTAMRIFARSIPVVLTQPLQYLTMFWCMLVSESWNWQFRGANPPAKLWRQTWRLVPAGSSD
jgi:cyclopropane-fatty-acyl-phospholipid synthase